MLCQIRKRTEPEDMVYSLHLYFNGLSLRNTSKATSFCIKIVKRSHSAIRDWIQSINLKDYSIGRPRSLNSLNIQKDETQIKVGSEYIWLWVAIESESKEIVGLNISKERNMFVVAERFLSDIIKEYGKHSVSTDGGTWYSQACQFLKIHHHIHFIT
ncbi:MAG: DDE-type integrase/transposase/recombinase [Candidatus Nitrosocosmicus sp.]